ALKMRPREPSDGYDSLLKQEAHEASTLVEAWLGLRGDGGTPPPEALLQLSVVALLEMDRISCLQNKAANRPYILDAIGLAQMGLAAYPHAFAFKACTGFAAAALAGQRASRRQNRSSALPTVVPVQSAVQRRALDQSSRYADLSLDEEQLIKNGKHILVAYIMKPKAGYDYLATAAHFAAESSTGTNVNVCTTDDFTKSVDALVYYIDPDNEEMKIAYPTLLFDRNITDGRAMMCSVLTLSIGNNQGMGDVEYGKIYDIYFPPAYLRLFDGPNCNVVDMWRILNRGMSNGGLIVGTIIKPKLGLQPKPFGEACYAFWQGGDFIKNDEPQGNQVFCQMNECIPEVVKAMRAAIKETGSSKLFSANITADDPNEMIARGGGSFGHKDGPKPGAISCRQGEESWKEWQAGKFGDVSLSDGIIEFAKTHEELKGAFLTFQKDADQIYPGWKEKLGYTGESSVQAATFDWAKKAAAAPYIGGWVYAKTPNVEGVYWNEVGPDGTAMNLAGNETNHPEKIKKDMHTPGSTLPISFYMNAVGYLPDGTPLNMAGNNVNHPERNGSPLPPPLKGYVNDIGYTPDGTPMDKAGNLSVKKCAAAAGGLMILGSSSQAFVSAPAVAASGHNLRASSALAAQSQPAASAAGASVAPVVACTGFAAAALAGQRASRRQNRSSALPTVVPVQSAVQRRALDQSSRYADLSLDEEQLIKNGKHLLVAYIMKPKAGYDYLATAAHFAAESSTGTNVNVCTTDDFTKSVDALVYYIDPDNEEMKIAYPTLLFDRNITDGRAMMCSVLTLSIGNNQGMGDVEYGKIYDIYFPPAYLRLFDGPNCNVVDMWRILNRGMSNGGLIVGTIIKPKLGLQPKPFGEACYAFWQGGDFIKNDEPQGNQVFCQMNECIPEVVKAMRAAIKETGSSKLFSANITADDPNEMIARGKYVLSQFGPLGENCGSFGHKDGPKPGAISCRQGEESWKEWKAGKFGDVSLSDGIIEFAKTHEELKGAFLTFQKDADQIYPGWKEKLGYTGESSVQAATFDWAKKAAAAPYIGGWVYAKTPNVEGVYWNEVGPDGTAMNLAGNETNHPEKIKKDMHTPGSTLPFSFYMNAVGYLPDGTPLNMAGNNVNHPERIGPDLHKNGSPLPPPLKGYVNDIGYTPDGTPMDKAGNLSVKK
ncbi:unnamed protein product, partial [Polarella glacialis]